MKTLIKLVISLHALGLEYSILFSDFFLSAYTVLFPGNIYTRVSHT